MKTTWDLMTSRIDWHALLQLISSLTFNGCKTREHCFHFPIRHSCLLNDQWHAQCCWWTSNDNRTTNRTTMNHYEWPTTWATLTVPGGLALPCFFGRPLVPPEPDGIFPQSIRLRCARNASTREQERHHAYKRRCGSGIRSLNFMQSSQSNSAQISKMWLHTCAFKTPT